MATSSAAQQGSAKPHAKYDRLIARAKGVEAAKTLIVHPCDETSLRGALEAAELGIIMPILVGPAAKIAAVARAHKLNLDGIEIIDVPHSEAAASKAVELVTAGMGELLMKGSLHTDELMRAVTASKTGLRTARRISHVFVMDVPTYSETLFITDARDQYISRSRRQTRHCAERDRSLDADGSRDTTGGHSLCGRDCHIKIPSTIEAAALCKMADRGQITGGILDGPLADNAIDPEAAESRHQVRGCRSCPDLVVPGSGIRQYARQEPFVHGKCGCRRHRTWRSRAYHPDIARRLDTHAHGVLCSAVLYADARRRLATVTAV